jgi:hypothetical protein
LRTRGDAYRLGLEAIVRKNKLENNVIFHNRFVDLKEPTPYHGVEQHGGAVHPLL